MGMYQVNPETELPCPVENLDHSKISKGLAQGSPRYRHPHSFPATDGHAELPFWILNIS